MAGCVVTNFLIMKKTLNFLVFIMLSSTIFGQDIIIDFAGIGGSSNVDTVEVVNLSNCTSIEVPGGYSLNLTTGTVVGVEDLVSFEGNLIQSYPNPFGSFTNIEFYVSQTDNVKISVSDISGKFVAGYNNELTAGVHSFKFIPGNAGMFFITVSGTDFLHTSKAICLSNVSQKAQLIYHEQVSDKFAEKPYKNSNSKDFSFEVGDTLKLKASSGDYATVITDEPTSSTTYTFEFVECTDYDGNNYAVVEIGDQLWMAENLKTSHYADGTEIPLVEDNTEWENLGNNNTDKAYCYYNNNANGEKDIYGALYTWAAASNGETSGSNVQGACPSGWHLPSDNEWGVLAEQVGGYEVAGGKLKSVCSPLWETPNVGANNVTGFYALPGGYRYYIYGVFLGDGQYCYLWTASQYNATTSWAHVTPYAHNYLTRAQFQKSDGFSIRCVKD